ncbi:MAG: hypothetical protein IE914_05220 [Thiotrichales bacterium]|nr:hypothetical protein [Thiotrichales bacterium]
MFIRKKQRQLIQDAFMANALLADSVHNLCDINSLTENQKHLFRLAMAIQVRWNRELSKDLGDSLDIDEKEIIHIRNFAQQVREALEEGRMVMETLDSAKHLAMCA